MTEISFPPLHDLSPGELEARRQHLVSEIQRDPGRRRMSPTIPRLRLRFAVPAVAAVCLAAAGAVVLSGTLGGSSTHRPGNTMWSAYGNQRPGALRPGITNLGNENPFGAQGKLVTLQQFVADMANRGYNVALPNSPLANSTNIGNVWENTATGEVIAYYPSSGIELNYGGTGVDYSGFSANQIQTINGVRAIVESAGSPGFPFSEVMLPIPSGHVVTLFSKGSVSDLVSVAQTMQSALPAQPPHFLPINLDFARGDEGITSIGVTINASTLGGTALLQVVRVERADITETSLAGGQVVFHERVPMTDLTSPKSGPPGTQPLSSWSGTLTPTDWDGGCQKAKYVITVKVSPANPTPEARGEWVESGMFLCGEG